MTLDLIDRAFIQRLAAPRSRVEAVTSVKREPIAHPVEIPMQSRHPVVPTTDEEPIDPVIEELFETAPGEWAGLAARVEAAVADGARVIALAGRERGEGRSTVARGLARMLRSHGHAAEHRDVVTGHDWGFRDRPRDMCLICDAGVWFPPGPVHRGRIARSAVGCHAIILVRRAARPPCPAHEQAIQMPGMRVLGEVVTFAAVPPQARR